MRREEMMGWIEELGVNTETGETGDWGSEEEVRADLLALLGCSPGLQRRLRPWPTLWLSRWRLSPRLGGRVEGKLAPLVTYHSPDSSPSCILCLELGQLIAAPLSSY